MTLGVNICGACRHYVEGEEEGIPTQTCIAFPDGIPEEIFFYAYDHRQPLEDETTLFELSDEEGAAEYLRRWEQFTSKYMQ